MASNGNDDDGNEPLNRYEGEDTTELGADLEDLL